MQMCNVYAHLYFCYCFVAVYRTTLFEKGEEIEIRSKNKKNPYVSQHNPKRIGTQVRIWGK